MLIKLNTVELSKCQKLLETKEANISAAEIYIDYLTNHALDITKNDMNLLCKKYSVEEAFFKAFLKKLKIQENDIEFNAINEVCNINNIKLLNDDEFLSDEFYRQISLKTDTSKDWIFTNLEYRPYEGFVYDEIEVDNSLYQEHTPIGFFNTSFPYLAVIQGEDIWMSIIPHEINTMRDPIKEAQGNVLVLGLGLGYYAFHVSNKSNVKKVTIVEKDETVIDMFIKHILPLFPNKNKIEIICDDAIKFVSHQFNFNYVFSDIWHNVGDGLNLYLQIKAKEKINPQAKFSYWIERQMLCMLRRQVLTVYSEQLDGSSEEDYLKAIDDNDKIINKIYFLTKDYKIESFKNLHQLLSEDSLKVLASKIY